MPRRLYVITDHWQQPRCEAIIHLDKVDNWTDNEPETETLSYSVPPGAEREGF